MKRTQCAQIAQETLSIFQQGSYTNAGRRIVDVRTPLEHCVSRTRLFTPGQLSKVLAMESVNGSKSGRTTFEVTGETTLEAAARLVSAHQDKRVGLLNFASAKNAGGGFLGGSVAQEESIARSSGLYPSLLRAPEYYTANRACGSLLYTHHMIYSPAVPVIRRDDGSLLEEPYVVDVLTAPAPNRGAIIQNGGGEAEDVESCMAERMAMLLALFASQSAQALILGAWGCGVFRNDPGMVAKLFAQHLLPGGDFHNRFESIVFAVYSTAREAGNTTAFQSVFASAES